MLEKTKNGGKTGMAALLYLEAKATSWTHYFLQVRETWFRTELDEAIASSRLADTKKGMRYSFEWQIKMELQLQTHVFWNVQVSDSAPTTD